MESEWEPAFAVLGTKASFEKKLLENLIGILPLVLSGEGVNVFQSFI